MADLEPLVIAVVGCLHGELDKMYDDIQRAEEKKNIKIDLILCCGDFQSVRNHNDLESMAVPKKYRKLMNFHKYYDGTEVAPILTVFIGGNHESADYLFELPYGGWVAKNIYYLGYSGVVNFGGLRIGGISGIYKNYNYKLGHVEDIPFTDSTMRSFYHIREIDVMKLSQAGDIDILLSHDWPTGIWEHGDCNRLLKNKPFFDFDIRNNRLGSPVLMDLLKILKPSYYFCAHLHVYFRALFPHPEKNTEFIALDKAVNKRHYFQIFPMGNASGPKSLSYDPRWLQITKLFAPYLLVNAESIPKINITDKDKDDFQAFHTFVIPENFEPFDNSKSDRQRDSENINQQTSVFCTKLDINNPCSRQGKLRNFKS